MSAEDTAAAAQQQPAAAAAEPVPLPAVDDAGDAMRSVSIHDDEAAEQAPTAASDSSDPVLAAAALPVRTEPVPTKQPEVGAAAATAPGAVPIADPAAVSTSDSNQQADHQNGVSASEPSAAVGTQQQAGAAADIASVSAATPADPTKSAPYAFTGLLLALPGRCVIFLLHLQACNPSSRVVLVSHSFASMFRLLMYWTACYNCRHAMRVGQGRSSGECAGLWAAGLGAAGLWCQRRRCAGGKRQRAEGLHPACEAAPPSTE